jgi:hypothetical protein
MKLADAQLKMVRDRVCFWWSVGSRTPSRIRTLSLTHSHLRRPSTTLPQRLVRLTSRGLPCHAVPSHAVGACREAQGGPRGCRGRRARVQPDPRDDEGGTAMKKLRIVALGISGGRSLTRPFRGARRFPSTRWYPVPKATRTPRKFGICPSFKDHALSPVPNLNSPIRNGFIAVGGGSGQRGARRHPRAHAGAGGHAQRDDGQDHAGRLPLRLPNQRAVQVREGL